MYCHAFELFFGCTGNRLSSCNAFGIVRWIRNTCKSKVWCGCFRAAASRNSSFRHLQECLVQDWENIPDGPHVVVHIPSVSGSDLSFLRTEHHTLLQMTRLCEIADQNVDVVYVAASAVDNEVEGYWKKLLEMRGIEQPHNRYRWEYLICLNWVAFSWFVLIPYRSHAYINCYPCMGSCRIVHPENSGRLPSKMSLTAKLLSSPRALHRIRNFIHGKKTFLIPGIVGDEEISLCVALNTPLMAPHPHVRQQMMMKSGSISLFRDAGIKTGPSQGFTHINHSRLEVEKSPLTPGKLKFTDPGSWTKSIWLVFLWNYHKHKGCCVKGPNSASTGRAS